MKPKNVKQLQRDSRKLRTERIHRFRFHVISGTDPAVTYIVSVRFDDDGNIYAQCNCPWALHQGVACSHVMAALEQLAETKGRKLSFWLDVKEARRQKHRVFYLARDPRDSNGIWITSRAG